MIVLVGYIDALGTVDAEDMAKITLIRKMYVE